MTDLGSSPLAHAATYPDRLDPGLLFPVDRAPQRAELGFDAALPFRGVDLWTAYELSWLDAAGKPAGGDRDVRGAGGFAAHRRVEVGQALSRGVQPGALRLDRRGGRGARPRSVRGGRRGRRSRVAAGGRDPGDAAGRASPAPASTRCHLLSTIVGRFPKRLPPRCPGAASRCTRGSSGRCARSPASPITRACRSATAARGSIARGCSATSCRSADIPVSTSTASSAFSRTCGSAAGPKRCRCTPGSRGAGASTSTPGGAARAAGRRATCARRGSDGGKHRRVR